MSTILTVAEFISDHYMRDSGDASQHAIQVAIDIAEGRISEALGYPVDAGLGIPTLTSQQWTESHPWPSPNRPLMLDRPRLISVDTVTALHDVTCDCTWTEVTECALVHQALESIIVFKICNRAASCWTACSCPHRIQVAYTAGFTAAQVAATAPIGRTLRLAIALVARDILQLQDYHTDGGAPVKSFSSLGYSESRDYQRTATGLRLGLGILAEQAATMIRPLMVDRGGAIILRSQ